MNRMSIALLFTLSCVHGQTFTVQVGGRPVGTRATLNFSNTTAGPTTGIVYACLDNDASNRVDCTMSLNTAVVATHDMVQQNENYCNSANGTTAYTCGLPLKALRRYQAGMTFVLTADATCLTSCTLNIDNLGPVSLKRGDGTTDPSGSILAGRPQWIFYDGKVFRLISDAAGTAATSTWSGPADQRGDVIARRVIGAMEEIPYAATINLDVTAGDLHKIKTANNVAGTTVNAATGGLPGQHMWIIIANDEISPKTIVFGARLHSAGPLTGSPAKSATLQFISDGTAWYEVARTRDL